MLFDAFLPLSGKPRERNQEDGMVPHIMFLFRAERGHELAIGSFFEWGGFFCYEVLLEEYVPQRLFLPGTFQQP